MEDVPWCGEAIIVHMAPVVKISRIRVVSGSAIMAWYRVHGPWNEEGIAVVT